MAERLIFAAENRRTRNDFKVLYGHPNYRYIDVTSIVLDKCKDKENWVLIPASDTARGNLFTDPLAGIVK